MDAKTRTGKVLAGTLLTLGAAAQACFLPQDEIVFPTLPQKQNSPLRIVVRTPGPEVSTTYLVRKDTTPEVANCSGPFKVSVEEPDLADTLRSRWYLDRGNDPASIDGAPVFGTGPGTREVVAPQALLNRLAMLLDGADHVVEVFVTDSEFTEQVGQAARAPVGVKADGGVLVDPAYVDSHLWLVKVVVCQ